LSKAGWGEAAELNYPADKGLCRSRSLRHDSHRLMWAVVGGGGGGRRGEGNVEVVKLSAAVELRDRLRELVAS